RSAVNGALHYRQHAHATAEPRAHLDTPTIAEVFSSLAPRGTSGERVGERGSFHRIGALFRNPLSLTLSPLLRRGERESTAALATRCARPRHPRHPRHTDLAIPRAAI